MLSIVDFVENLPGEEHNRFFADRLSGKYYVYVLMPPCGKVFYVGKGQKSRIHCHEAEARKGVQSPKCDTIRKIWAEGGKVYKQKVAFFDDEATAYELEKLLVSFFGLENLTNLSEGGYGAARPGSGRPLELGKSKLVGFDCPAELWDQIVEEAQVRGLTRAELIRKFLREGLEYVEDITISAEKVDSIVRGHHQGLSQHGNTVSFQAKEKARFGPLRAMHYLLVDNTVIYHIDEPKAKGTLPTAIGTEFTTWSDLRKVEGAEPGVWHKDPDGKEWGVLGLSYDGKGDQDA